MQGCGTAFDMRIITTPWTGFTRMLMFREVYFLGLVSCIYPFYKDSIARSRHLALSLGGEGVD